MQGRPDRPKKVCVLANTDAVHSGRNTATPVSLPAASSTAIATTSSPIVTTRMKPQPSVVTHGHDIIGPQDTSSPPGMEEECGTLRKRARCASHSAGTSKRLNLSNLRMPPNMPTYLPHLSSSALLTLVPSVESKPKPFEVPTNRRNKTTQNS